MSFPAQSDRPERFHRIQVEEMDIPCDKSIHHDCCPNCHCYQFFHLLKFGEKSTSVIGVNNKRLRYQKQHKTYCMRISCEGSDDE
ncbi:hypothetical protein EJB05_52352 [Eragrostis curvula]|uniref:Uncharacterized protein n=1 Tax=Eragrostis curvula TaxID=38414 RepID=A0A5J9STA6_9POAL|nr:hypothetical protein EJB05_52352 [Eragrostis curvula]